MELIDNLNAKFIQSLEGKHPKLSLAVKQGKIRLTRIEDDFATISDLMGDCFDTSYCTTDQARADIAKEKTQFKRRIYNQKVWIYTSSYWDGREWNDVDSVGGFVGYDFFGSNYDIDQARLALEAYEEQDLDAQGFVIDPYRAAA